MYREMKLTTKGEFGGLGFVISMKEGNLTVLKVIPKTPAHRAGIKAVLIPKDNVRDLDLLPEHVRTELEIIPVTSMDEVLSEALPERCRPAKKPRNGIRGKTRTVGRAPVQ